jgi:hypothetical protein
MRDDIRQAMWLKQRDKKGSHWSILTLDDLDKTKEKYSQLIAQLQAKFQAANGPGKAKPSPK